MPITEVGGQEGNITRLASCEAEVEAIDGRERNLGRARGRPVTGASQLTRLLRTLRSQPSAHTNAPFFGFIWISDFGEG